MRKILNKKTIFTLYQMSKFVYYNLTHYLNYQKNKHKTYNIQPGSVLIYKNKFDYCDKIKDEYVFLKNKKRWVHVSKVRPIYLY